MRRPGLRWAVAGAVVLALVAAIALLARTVARDLSALSTARSDNVQWTLTQAELELAGFRAALARAASEPAQIAAARQAFDILYSRIGILSNSSLYAELREDPLYARSLVAAEAFLAETVPLIDGPDAALLAEAEGSLALSAERLAPQLRTLSTSGLARYTDGAAERRAQIAATLTRLAAAIAVLLVGLAVLALRLARTVGQGARQRAALEEAGARMETILGTSLDGVIVSDAKGTILDFNAAAEEIFGRARQDVVGRTVGEIVVPPHMREAHEAGMERMAAGGPRHVVGKGRVQLEGMRADGTVFPVELALQTAEQGGETIVVGYLRDISARVAAERELTEARDRALAGEKSKADFLAVMSHEIRTPLNGLLGSLELLEGAAPGPEQARLIGNMRLSGDVLLGHVSDVLDIARMEAGKMKLAPAPADLCEVMREVAGAMAGPAEAAGDALTWEWVGEAPGWVMADAGRLRQILMNLVGNAVKFTEGGRIGLEGEVLSEEGGTALIELRVADTGIGIPEAEIPRLFEDFETQDASYGRSRGGTGLGLGIARRLVAAMSGEIGAESEEGEGSLFWLRLPLERCEAPEAGADAPEREARALDVLLVEDNEINRVVATEMLRRAGHAVTEAVDGREGVSLAGARSFDLILMDISMPVMDGRAATRAIREGGGPNAGTRIVALTANVLPEDVARFREDGMDGALAKPLTRAALAGALAGQPRKAPAGVLDDAQLEEAREGVGTEALARLLARFAAEMDEALPSLSGEGDEALAHRLAGSAALFGAVELRAALLAAEAQAKAGREVDAAPLAEAWARTRAAIGATPRPGG